MKRFLVVAAEPLAQAGVVGTALLEAGHLYDTILPVQSHATWAPKCYPGFPEDCGAWSGLIILGGAMSANDEAEHPFIARTMDLVHSFDRAGRPVLGICLGAQIIARAYGGAVRPMAGLETGFVPVSFDPTTEGDPVFDGVARQAHLFQNHYEAVAGLEGATVFASSELCPVQAFRIGELVYATQFHFEVTLDIARDWYRVSPTLYDNAPHMERDLDRQFTEHFSAQRTLGAELTRRWAALAS